MRALCLVAVTVALFIALTAAPSFGQGQTGLPPWTTFDSSSFATVDLSNLNIHFDIPIRSLPGRLLPMNVHLVSDTDNLGTPGPLYGAGSQVGWPGPGTNYVLGTPQLGTFAALGFMPGWLSFDSSQQDCIVGIPPQDQDYGMYTIYSNFSYVDANGTLHTFNPNVQVATLTSQGIECATFQPYPGWGTNMQVEPLDGSQYSLFVTSGSGAPNAYVVDLSDGVTYASGKTFDLDGNVYTVASDPNYPVYSHETLTDSSGNAALNVVKNSTSMTFSYTGPNGSPENIVVSTIPFTGTLAVNCPNLPNPPEAPYPYGSSTQYLVSSISLPDGTSYSFTYDPVLGRPQTVTLPTGGQITYNYNGPNNGVSCVDGGGSGFTKTTPDGTWTYARTYNSTTQLWTTTVTDPPGNQTVHTFGGGNGSWSYSLNQGANSSQYEINRQVYQNVNGQQVLLKTVVTCYNGNFTNCATDPTPTASSLDSNNGTVPPFQKDIYTYLPNLSGPSLSEIKFLDPNRITEDKEYDFGASIPPSGNFISDRQVSYIYGCVTSDITTNSAGTTLAKTTASCDSHAHPSTVNKWISGSIYATTTYTYYKDSNNNETGVLNSMTDPRGTLTTYSNLACNNSFPQTVTTGTLTTTMQWDCNGEVPTSLTDANSQPTSYSYGSDPFWRRVQTTYPDAGQTTTTYNDTQSPPNYVTSVLQDTSGNAVQTEIDVDGLNRPIRSIISSSSGTVPSITVDTTYDSLGRVASVSNPYYPTHDTTYGITKYYYDALNRMYQRTNQDGSTQWWCYNDMQTNQQPNCRTHSGSATGTWVDSQDEVTNDTQRTSDALGRLLEVMEPGGTSQVPSMETDYSYDPLGNLTTVNQKGISGTDTPRLRTFSYDGLSRLLCASNPENSSGSCPSSAPTSYVPGTTGYTYDADGNVLTKTDARSITTTYSYDSLNHILSKTYSDGTTSNSCYQYSLSSVANGIGRMANEWTQSHAIACQSSAPSTGFLTMKSVLAYDAMGRAKSVQQEQCIASICGGPYALTFNYDLAGNRTTLTNSVGAQNASLMLTDFYDALGRPCLATSSWSGPSTSGGPAPLNLFQSNPSASAPGYWGFGALQDWYLGSAVSTASSLCNTAPNSPLHLTSGYNNRLWVTGISAAGQVP